MGAQGANAEISAYNQASGYLYTVGGGSGAIVVSDLRNPTAAKIVAKAIPSVSGQTLQSVAVFGKLLAVAVQNSVKTDNGFVQFYDLTNPALPLHLSTVNVGALPDMVKFSSDGKKLLVTNEAEPNTTYTLDPVGSISLIDTTGYLATTPVAPDQAQVQTVDFSAWNNRKAELSNRGIRITGKAGVTTTLAQDIEPEAIAITADGNTAYVSLQENNGIAVLDIGTTTPKITSIFSAGIQDWDRGLATAKNFSYTLSYAAGAANLPAGVQAGGLSGLWFDGVETINGQALDIYYSITDRGPNGTLTAGKRQFLDPDFQPSIYKLGMNRATGAVSELAIIGLKRPDGTALTGLPQLQGKDEIPVDATNLNLAYDPFGIDSETISIFTASIGGVSRKVFAVGDEYRGQIGLFDFSTGKLIQRYIPAGQKALLQAQHGSVIGAETIDSLPAIYGNRWANRGIEGMAFNSKDGLLYAFMQSPLDIDSNGDGVVAERSKSELTRILAIDPATGAPVKEHLYLLSGRTGQDKIGDVTYDASRGVFLVMERDSSRLLNGFKSVYEVDLRGATNTLSLTLASQVSETALPAQAFMVGTEGRAVFREVIDAGELGNNGYRFNGIPDGIGVTDNGDGTLRVLVTHELRDTAGDVRAHGSKGAYVSDLTIDKASLSVISGKDFLASANDLFLASADGSTWTNGTTTAFNRFCSADLPAATAFRNGTNGYAGRIFLSGEESGAEGRAFAHVLDGTDAGKVYEVASLGNLSFENVVANPFAQDKTVVASLDDTITNGQVYLYVGTKSTTGNAIQQAGLAGGTTYGVRVNSTGTTNTEVGNLASPNETGLGLNGSGIGTFELVNLGDVKAKTGAALNSESIAAGVTNWLRPEDGAWSKDGKTFYFVTTATATSASRLWALEFTNLANPEAGGTVKMLLNGSEGQVMLDNMTVADDGSILLQEDPGGNARLAKIWRYNPSTDTLVELAQHNPVLFGGTAATNTNFITNDEESSGIVDISSYLTGVSGYDTSKYSYFLIADQIHKAVSSPTSQVELGELSVMATAKADAKQQIVPETALPAQAFMVGTEGRAVFREVIDAGELGNNGYRFNGIPDGIGVTDNGDGTLRVLVTHELRDTAGDVRAHGSKGAYVSDLTIDKASLSVISGKDFLASANDLFLASADGSTWTNGTTTAFNRFCSADLPAATAFRNGTNGYAGRIFLSGEESGAEGRAFAHVLDGTDAGKVYEVASLGNLSFENVVANPFAQDKTVVASLDDTITNGQVYLYVGTKSTTGNAIQQAGLAGGTTYGVRVNSTGTTNTEVGNLASPNETGLGLNGSGIGTFELVNLGDVKAKTGAALNSESIAAGVTNWLRPEDGAWSKDGKTFYFVTTATATSASRLWALEFTNLANPEAGGTVKMLLNGSEGQVMLDNMTVADDGSILLQEDPGGNARLAKIWRYNPSTDTLVELAQHNPVLFGGTAATNTNFITNDEESSGIVDISSYLTGVSGYDTSKYSYFLIADQIHKAVSSPTSQVELGELSVMVTAKAGVTGTASWLDTIGVASPELLDNSLTLVNGVYNASSADRLAAAGIQLANKVELFNLPSVGGTLSYDKPEGLTLRDDGAVVINYDNDFGGEGASGNAFTVVSFSNPALDTEDSGDGGGYKPATNHDVYGLTMPDGLATFTYNGENFILAAGEGDDRNDFLDPDETSRVSVLLTAAAGATDAQKAGLLATNSRRLNILTNTGDLDRDGIVDQAYTLGSRSLRIFDSKGNVVFDSGTALEDLAFAKGLYPVNSREDDKGVEPEMVEVFTINGRTYAFVALERTTTSMAAIFDVTNPYAPVAVEPIQFPGAQRIEGITFLTTATNAARSVIASSEGNDVVSLVDFPIPYSLQILSYYGESGLLGIETAPILGALIDKFDDQYTNTLKLGEGDTFIPGPWLIGGADPSLNAIPGIGSTALARPDFAIFNAFGTDVSALGNHEFDQGSPVLQGAFAASGAWAGAQFPFITANLNFAADSSLRGLADASIGGSSANAFAGQEASAIKGKIAPYAVVTEGGEKIGIVGATTFDLLSKSSPNGTVPKDDADPSTSDLQEVALYVQAAVDVLRARGINKIVMVDQLDTLERNKALAPLLRGVDVMVAGGGHERLGDANDVPVAFNGHDADFIPTDRFPIVTAGADGKPTLIITTDTEFTYLGRLVVDFDANGEIILSNLNSIINGAYAATEANLQAAYGTTQSATEIIAGSVIGTKVKAISDAINNVIVSKDGTIFGYTNVYLEGDRVFGRTQEVNLGDITADANLAKAKAALGAGAVLASLKNGGGIRASIGSVGESGEKLPPAASPVKPVGAISLLDIENALRFDNKLMVFDSTPQGLLNILEFAAGLSSGAAQQSGGYAQIGGVHFSYDPSKPAGQKVQDVAIYDEAGNLVAKVADNGKLLAGAPATISVVALNFTANGGDGYPIKYLNPPNNSTVNNETGNFRYILANGTLSAPVNRNLDFTASTTFASVGLSNTDLLGEQKAFQDFLLANHATPETAYATTDTHASLDQRIQNLQVKTQDTVLTLDTLPNGVASGDVDQDSVVLWTRSTALGQATFEISTTADFAQIAGSATASVTNPNQPVKVEISGLNAGTDYFYRVIDAAGSMAKGSFETAAAAGRFTGLRFGISGDWRGELAPYPSIGNAAGKDLDFFVELGNTIYADVASDAVLNPDGSRKSQVTTLDEFRAKHEEVYSVRYGVNTWEDLRGSTAIYATIDDHEVINDFAGGAAAASDPRFGTTQGLINDTELFDNGLTAFQEYNPIRDVFNGNTGDSRTAGERDLYRFNRFGSDAASFLLDTRSFRDPELVAPNTANPADVARFLNESLSLDRTLLGADQLSRLKADLLSADRSGITWKFVMVPEPIQELGIYNTDAFEGYAKERKEILKFIETNGIRNVVFVAADIHGTMVNNLTYTEAVGGPRVATDTWEITTGSVAYSKPFGQTVVDFATAAGLLSAPQKAFYDSLPIAPDGDDLLNDKDDFLSKAFQDLVIGPAGYDPIGLNTNLTGGPGVIGSFDVSASLIQGDYVAAHTYGWTQFDIDPATQQLNVTTYGIDPYSEAELKANPAGVLARVPRIVSQFTVEAQYTAIEIQGNTKLVRRGDGKAFVEYGAGRRQEISSPWNSPVGSEISEWQMIAADTITGTNQILWRNNTSSFLHTWSLDVNWNWQSYGGADGFNTAKAWELETSFQVDATNDGIIGAPPYTTLEAQGNTKLLSRGDGLASVEYGAGRRQEISSPWNSPVGSDISEWQMLAAETIAGSNQILWRNNNSSFLHTWSLDANWTWQSSSGADGFNTAKAWELETSFQVDGNRDGIIGPPL
jgi:phosphodiesterase/alkaline phosphatase D-like protein/2',3'-cyclic-nucleotide 2'-phosphodiesterase (5'-nucleotidase family)/sugar lactone lactonase YvrE